ncbi:hypothetical protein [Chitinophaga sp.]|uniref:hypothetical protein n=1 Tax=Chitinophaga sp. TaxID=1869181 RepID=UPI002F930B0A
MFSALAQTQHIIVHETRISSGTPWHIYIAALLAAIVAIIGWVVVHRTSQGRDLLNWRRTTLVQSTMELLETSNERFEAVNVRSAEKNTASDLMRKLTRHYETIRLIADHDLNDAARAVWDAHTFSANAISRMEPGIPQTDSEYEQRKHLLSVYSMDEWELQGQHEILTSELKRTISKKRRFGKPNQDGPQNVDPDLTASSQINRAKVNKE